MNLLTVRNLRTYLHTEYSTVQAVDGVNFTIQAGETFCLVGESGSGKSITALSIMRLFPSNLVTHPSGEIWLSGTGLELNSVNLDELAQKRRAYAHRAVSHRYTDETNTIAHPADSIDLLQLDATQLQQIRGAQVSMIFQEPMTSLNPVMTIGDQISEVLLRHQPSLLPQEIEERVIQALEQVQLSQARVRLRDYPHQLSGGQRQRVMIAMALVIKPRLLIADEPTTALDVTVQAEILRLMRDLQAQTGMSMLFITHDFGVVAQMAHQVGVMQRGRIVEVGAKDQVLLEPRHTYTKQLLAAVPENLTRQLQQLQPRLTTADSEPAPPKQSIMPLLELHNLHVWFPIRKGLLQRRVDHVKAVDGVSLSIGKGQIVALVGESGCGKTTLGRAIVQLVRPSSGQIIMEAQDLTQLKAAQLRAWRKKMQMVFQDPQSSLNPRLLVETMLTEPMAVHGIGADQDERIERAKAILSQVQLSPNALWHYPHEFSGGQRQRIGLARALAVDPDFIVCDEITSALDVSVQAEILQLLLDIRQQRKLTLLFITHNMGVVEYLSDQTVVMYRGQVVEQGVTTSVCNHPQHAYTQQLLEAVPRLVLQAA